MADAKPRFHAGHKEPRVEWRLSSVAKGQEIPLGKCLRERCLSGGCEAQAPWDRRHARYARRQSQ